MRRAAVVAEQLAFPIPAAGFNPVDLDWANVLLARWGHYLGPCNRPFLSQAWALEVDGLGTIAVAVSASAVSEHVTGTDKDGKVVLARPDIVELARLCSHPAHNWATRPMLRLWREVAAPRWSRPNDDPRPPAAAIAYSQNGRHDGSIYRFDGWTRIADRCGSAGGGTYSRKRDAGDAALGHKSLWLWRYQAGGDA